MKKILFGFLAINFVSSAMAVGASETDRADLKSKLQDNYDAVRGNEQSLANRTLGATAMATVGAGGQMTASSLSEQKSDADAERDMAAYLATFRCDWGSGRNVRGGETNVELPGAGQLIPMYSEYVTLANDLKLRKAQLGLKAGIESEPILDSATTGLYDDVSTGISSGAYASLARALQNPNGADAKMWAEQKEKTAENLKTGVGLVATGVAASVAGNAIINRDAPRDRSREIIAEFESLKRLENAIDQLPEVKPTECPKEAPGTHPYCDCGNFALYIEKDNRCEPCPEGQVVYREDNVLRCVCPEQKPLWDSTAKKCFARAKTCEKSCNKAHMYLTGKCTCDCNDGFTYDPELEICKCEGEGLQVINDVCHYVTEKIITESTRISVTKTVNNTVSKINLNTANMFEINKAVILPTAEETLEDFVEDFNNEINTQSCTDVHINIDGYTDPTGREAYNLDLSKKRAEAIGDFLDERFGDSVTIDAEGKGEVGCTCGVGNKTKYREDGVCKGKVDEYPLRGEDIYQPCRRAEVTITGNCTTTTTETETETQIDTQTTEKN